MEEEHLEHWSEALSCFQSGTTVQNDTSTEDPRPVVPGEDEQGEAGAGEGKIQVLSDPAAIESPDLDCKSFDNSKVLIIKKNGEYFLKATADLSLPRGFRIAGCGGGKLTQQQGAHSVGFELDQGDKTWVEVAIGQSSDDAEVEGVVKKGSIEHRATLYQVLKEFLT